MTTKIEWVKKISPAIYGLALVCFFLPFSHISCQGEKIATLTGVQLVTGTTIGSPEMSFGSRENRQVDPEPLAILAFLCTFGGVGVSVLRGKKGVLASAITGCLGLTSLLLLRTKIDNEVLREGEGAFRVEYGIGFWLALLLFIAAIGLNAFLFSQLRKKEEETVIDDLLIRH
ncbi:MAG: hypothetical protein COU42_02990 [Candidatus Nealsonbacteria bacterium CG10_big_fil_rev_8_21_14_0_10_36_24]|uniref:DUF4293 domain-containing protein n=2 Tax=Candidatus Nealsoniibacteriota TaxID=1817911 RepID=A0A2H0YQN9_9BACT|nr:MAG: hypothetical protein COU42_02990 [Candidatus Nealsonbacteria bacterium CG10_big_fil_rev_8_21_14_0_10_36_24]PIS40062.1 MAG: hypothetical protein COT32_01780 [Candidatus Nealsonbacteria bacterium CG08_land_8_20_14_0_20_36_22]